MRKLVGRLGELGRGPGGYWLCFALLSAGLFWAFATDRYFSADGVAYYASILGEGWFTDFAWSRNHAVYLSQWPLVLGVRAGLRDLDQLELLFALGLYLPYLLSFLCCAIACRGGMHHLLVLPLASIVLINYASDAVMTGEHHVFTLLTWPILLFSLRREPLRPLDITLLLLLLVAYLRLYESAIATAPVLLLVHLIRLVALPGRGNRFVSVLAIALLLGAAAIAAHAVLYPRDPANRSSFLSSILEVAINPETVLGLVFVVPFLFHLFRDPDTKPPRVLVGWFLLLPVVALFVPTAAAGVSFSTRTLTLVLLPPLLLVSALVSLRPATFSARTFGLFLLFVSGSLIVHLAHSRAWISFRSDFHQVLNEREGYVAAEDTPLPSSLQFWNWTNPILSSAWSREKVRAIVENPEGIPRSDYAPPGDYYLADYFPEAPEFLENKEVSP